MTPLDRSSFPSTPRLRTLVGLGLGASMGTLGAQLLVPEWALPAAYGSDRPDTVEVSLGGAEVEGDAGRFQARTGLTEDSDGGLESLTLFRELGEDLDADLNVRARALVVAGDVELEVRYRKFDVWFLHFELDQNRRWYDASTLYAEDLDLWVAPEKPFWELDWGVVRLQTGTVSDSSPKITLTLAHHYRKGEKDATLWGQTGALRLAPAHRAIDEQRDVIALEVSDENADQRWAARARYEHAETDNTLATTHSTGINAPETLEHREQTESDTVSLNGFYARQLGDKAQVSLGGTVVKVDANLAGYRDIANGSAFATLSGQSELTLSQINGNFAYQWSKHLQSVVALAVKGEELTGDTARDNGFGPKAVDVRDERDHFDFATEMRYSGYKRTRLYVLFRYNEGDGELAENGDFISRRTDSETLGREIRAGLRYYSEHNWSLHASASRHHREDHFTHQRLDLSPSLYPGYLNDLIDRSDEFRLRLTWRPHPQLHLASRLDQRHDSVSATIGGITPDDNSSLNRLTLSQSVTWRPREGLHLQVTASRTEARQFTPASASRGALERLVLPAINDHWTLQASLFAVLNEKTDLRLTYATFRARNLRAESAVAFPYDVGETEQRLNLILSRQLAEHLRGIIRYGYYRGRDDRSPDFENYQAQVLYGSLHYRF